MMAGISISHDDIIDVEFETITYGFGSKTASKNGTENESRPSADHLALLREQFSHPQESTHPDALSPTFLAATLFCAFVVFWVSGGHTLLY
jgi:hypothetical protein